MQCLCGFSAILNKVKLKKNQSKPAKCKINFSKISVSLPSILLQGCAASSVSGYPVKVLFSLGIYIRITLSFNAGVNQLPSESQRVKQSGGSKTSRKGLESWHWKGLEILVCPVGRKSMPPVTEEQRAKGPTQTSITLSLMSFSPPFSSHGAALVSDSHPEAQCLVHRCIIAVQCGTSARQK